MSSGSIDLKDLVCKPFVGIDVSTDEFKLVDVVHVTGIVLNGEHLSECYRIWSKIVDIACACAHNQALAVVGKAPSLTPVFEFAQLFEGSSVINEAYLRFIGKLVYLVVQKGNALAEKRFTQIYRSVVFPGSEVHTAYPCAAIGRLIRGARAFIKLALINSQSLCKS